MSQAPDVFDESFVLTLEEVGTLAAETGKPAETLMNVVALIARRFKSDVCSAYLLEPDRANLVLAATVGLRPECIGTLRMGLHEGLAGLVAEGFASLLRSIDPQRHQPGGGIKPAHQRGMPGQPFRLPGHFRENLLGDILGGMHVAVYQPQGGGIDQVHMPPGQFGEGGLRPVGGIAAYQFGIFSHDVP